MIDKHVLSSVSSGATSFWFFLFLSVVYFFVCMIKNRKIVFSNFTSNLWVVGIGVCILLADLFYYASVSCEGSLISVISIIIKLSVFISVVLAGIFLNEANLLKKLSDADKIFDLSEAIPKYMPNYMKIVNANEATKKEFEELKTDGNKKSNHTCG